MYAVAGVTGHTGGFVASSLLDRGKKIRVMVRTAVSAAPWQARGAEAKLTHLEDTESLRRAIDGAEGVYLLIPPNPNSADMVGEYRRYAGNMVEALKGSSVRHVVLLSAWGAHRDDGPFPTHHESERLLRSTGIPLTIVRASFFMENTLPMLTAIQNGGVLPSYFPADLTLQTVATQDVGALAATKLVEGPKSAGIVEVTGPEDCSMNDFAHAYGLILDKPVEVKEIAANRVADAVVEHGGSITFGKFYQNVVADVVSGRFGPESPALVVRTTTGLMDFARVAATHPQAYLS